MRLEYGHSLYCHDLEKWAKAYLLHIPPNVNYIVSTGSSGCAIASAMVVLSELNHLYIRKAGENAHSLHAGDNPAVGTEVVIVDDFCVSGASIQRCLNFCSEYGLIPVRILTTTDSRYVKFTDIHKQVLIDSDD